eukprot:s2782_g7.t1
MDFPGELGQVYHLNRLVASLPSPGAGDGSWRRAAEVVFGAAETWRVVPDVVSYNSLMASLPRRRWSRALQLLQWMGTTGVQSESNLVGLNCALTLAAHGGHWQLLLQQLDSYAANGATGNAWMAHCQERGVWIDAVQCLSLMQQRKLETSWRTRRSAVGSLGLQSWRKAYRILHLTALTADDEVGAWHAAATSAGRAGQWLEALRPVQALQRRRLTLDAISWNVLVDAMAKSERWQRSLDVLREMRRTQIRPNHNTRNGNISAAGWRLACHLLRFVTGDATVATNAAADNAPWPRALQLWRTARRRGIQASSISFNTITSSTSAESWPNALQLHRVAAWEGVAGAGSAPSRHAIIGAVASAHLWSRILHFLENAGVRGAGGAWLKAWQLFATLPTAADRMTCDMVVYSSERAESPSDVTWVTRSCCFASEKTARRG